jgi:teichuronic acid biosynthesis glycosyltransferase TuaC
VTERVRVVLFSTVFPNPAQPGLGIFVRERLRHVARHVDVMVVAPVPWFPGAHLLRKGYRPRVVPREEQDGLVVLHPRFLSFPGVLKSLDGVLLAISSLVCLWRLRRRFPFQLIDAHFCYPEGVAACLLGGMMRVPVAITLRGTLPKLARYRLRRWQMTWALRRCAALFAVARSLLDAAAAIGAPPDKGVVAPNGVDVEKFTPIPQEQARSALGLPAAGEVVISVGALTPRKGFQRIIRLLPRLLERFPHLSLVVVGGPSVEGDNRSELEALADELGVADRVVLAGSQPHDELYKWLSAADCFCLVTANEGWANVLGEAMACGLPVVTTDVGGNREVVDSSEVGLVVPLGDEEALYQALVAALARQWDRPAILARAAQRDWQATASVIVPVFQAAVRGGCADAACAEVGS